MTINPGEPKKPKDPGGDAIMDEIDAENIRRPTNRRCVALREETGSMSVGSYFQSLGPDITEIGEPAGELQRPQPPQGNLTPPAKTMFFRIIHFAFDEVEDGWPFSRLDEENLVITDLDIPKILVDTRVEATEATVSNSVTQLANLLVRILTIASPLHTQQPEINLELQHLIRSIRDYKKGSSSFLIRYHCAMVPMINRSPLLIKMFDHVVNILRFTDREAYIIVMENLEYPADWDDRVKENKYLALYLQNGHYDPAGKSYYVDADLEPLRFLRHCPSHAMSYSAGRYVIELKRKHLYLALYQRLPHVVLSLQVSLHKLGELQDIDIDSEFPGKVRVVKQ